jgi:hypothetical protein
MGATIGDTLTRIARAFQQQSLKLRRHVPSPIGGGSDDDAALQERLAAAIKAGHPKAYCFTCLGSALELSPSKLREAAQILVLRGGFRAENRTWVHCGRPDNAIVVDEGAGH